MANKRRRCRECKTYKESSKGLLINNGFYCDIACATNYAYKNKEKGRKIKHTTQKKELKGNDKGYRDKCAQTAFNAYIRFRDNELPCISCGRNHVGQYHAGHYRSRGAHPELRFEELNCHKQCAPCNNHLSGNISNYRPALIDKIGMDKVDWLEGPHELIKYSCEDLKRVELKYKRKLKEAKQAKSK